jgi:hypothetical protein
MSNLFWLDDERWLAIQPLIPMNRPGVKSRRNRQVISGTIHVLKEEVNAEYSTTTELADVLQRDADVPFRAGHHFASELVTHGRANQRRPGEIPYTQAQRLYAATAAAFGLLFPSRLPSRSSAVLCPWREWCAPARDWAGRSPPRLRGC